MVQRWRTSELALTVCSAAMLLHLGAPRTLSGLPEFSCPLFGHSIFQIYDSLTTFARERIDLCDFVAASSYKTHSRVRPLVLAHEKAV